MYGGDASPPRCRECGYVRSPEWIDPAFTLPPGHRPDVSFTYDGRLIVSDNFRAACKSFQGTTFRPLPALPGWHLLLANDVVAFDVVRRQTRFGPTCSSCRTPSEAAGATPAFLTGSPVLADAFFRSDVEFGSGDEMHPLLLVGTGVAETLGRQRLTGLELMPIDA